MRQICAGAGAEMLPHYCAGSAGTWAEIQVEAVEMHSASGEDDQGAHSDASHVT